MSDNAYHELFPLGADDAPYRKLTGDHVSTGSFEGRRIVKVEPEALTLLAAAGVCRFARICCGRAIWRRCARSSTTPRPRRTTGSSPSTS